jgi:signal transduction histidine kinase/CheY-like chemotaxis protein
MQLTNPAPNTDRPPSPRSANNIGVTTLRHAWKWLTLVQADDPVRLVLNRGFAAVITVVILLNAVLGPALLMSDETAAALVTLVSIPFYTFLWWLNRRGTVYGATLFVLWAAIGITLGSIPSSYASANAPIPLIFVFPMIIATLFIRPRAGVWALLLQMALLGVQLAFSDVPREDALRFMIVGTLNLALVMAFLMVGASIFSRALRASIAANQSLQQLNAELEQRVAVRTADLAAANDSLQGANHSLLVAKQDAERARAAAEEANRYKSHFLANMSHELRTPLNAILNFADFLGDMEYGPVNEQQKMFQSRILYNGEHLLGLINDILDLSKIEAGKVELIREPADLHPLFHGVMATAVGLTKDKGLTLDLEADEQLPPVLIDRTRIRQVLLNLLSNAAKFTELGGITVRAYVDHRPPTTDHQPQTSSAGDEQLDERGTSVVGRQSSVVVIEVQDTGIGIAPEYQARVFEEFQQVQDDYNRRHQGSGLGLPISKRLIELHGGQIWLDSTPGVGSTFTFTLPIADVSPEEYIAALASSDERLPLTPANAAAQGARLIAVVDDDPDAQRILRHILEGAGYQVQSILDSQVALHELRRNSPSLILLDLNMAPLDGWMLLDQLHQDPLLAAIPAAICSVLDPERGQIGLLSNVAAYLPKPARQEDVLALVRLIAPAGSVLIVDDDLDARQVLRHLLDKFSYQVFEASSGPLALALIPELHPSLMLLDLMMPGMDGFEVLEQLQELPAAARVPVVVVTATDLDEEQRAWLRERTRHCFRKPTPAPEFLDVIHNLLKGADHVQAPG